MKLRLASLTLALASLLAPLGEERTASAAGVAPPKDVCDRGCWGARPPQCAIGQEPTIDRAIIHHTAASTDMDTTSIDDSMPRVRAHQNLHMDVNGWCDIGYQFLIDRFGNAFEGREGSLTSYPHGAHDSVNTRSFGFSLMGYFHPPYNQQPPDEMRGGAYDLIAWIMPDPFTGYDSGIYGGHTVGFVGGHRNVIATACPGDIMYAYIGDNYFDGEARNQINARIIGATESRPLESPLISRRTEGESKTEFYVVAFDKDAAKGGIIESPPVALAFPSNAFAPLWRAQAQSSGDIAVEIALSADGKTWGRWLAAPAPDPSEGSEIEPKLPDGRPNPSFGYTAGELLSTGNTEWRFIRYRITLRDKDGRAPAVESLRLFYQNTTFGRGRIPESPTY